jgi:hypothetical protein
MPQRHLITAHVFSHIAVGLGLLTLVCVLIVGFAFIVTESHRKEQGPPKHRHFHRRYGLLEVCDSTICAPKYGEKE